MEPRVISRRRFLSCGGSLASVLAFRGYVAPDDAVADTTRFPGRRFFPGLGVRGGRTARTGNGSEVRGLYDRFAAPRENRYFFTTPRYWFVAEKKFSWRELLVDENKPPSSHAQARDPA